MLSTNLLLLRLRHRHLRGVEHVFNENPVPRCRIVDENVGDGTDELAVLNDGGAAHALYDAAGLFQELSIGHFDGEAFAAFGVAVDIGDLHLISADAVVVKSAQNVCGAVLNIVLQGNGDGFFRDGCRLLRQDSVDAAFGVAKEGPRFAGVEKAFDLTRRAADAFGDAADGNIYHRAALDGNQ